MLSTLAVSTEVPIPTPLQKEHKVLLRVKRTAYRIFVG